MGLSSRSFPFGQIYMKKKAIFYRENQLLYAVLQVDKKEEELRLSCRWLDDLTKADEKMIEACDKAYDKAKQMQSRIPQAKHGAPKPAKGGAAPKKMKSKKRKRFL